MSDELKLLFVCSQNEWRSRTAEKVFGGIASWSVRSAGTAAGARIKVNEGHVAWADVIFVMEKRHGDILRERFPGALTGKPVHCLHIPDDYVFMHPELIEMLRARVAGHLEIPE